MALNDPALKFCTGCEVKKETTEFYKNRTRPDGLSGECKICKKVRNADWASRNRDRIRQHNRNHYVKSGRGKHLLETFGISETKYHELLMSQRGVCGICLEDSGPKVLAVDHDHTTGEVRGLLCGKCNQALGLFRESLENLDRASSYLLKYYATKQF